MSDVAIIVVKSGTEIAPAAVYLHGHGPDALKILKKAVPRMRLNDPCYSVARLIGECHKRIKGNRGLGVVEPPSLELLESEDLSEYSHWDAGVIVYDCGHGGCALYAGYLADQYDGQCDMPVPPM
jgi:hypothetical protein